jgi:phage terminase Nu1 subunit (DNA packaging protein)
MTDTEKPKSFGIGRGIGPIATTAQICKVLNLTQARVAQLVKEGIIKKEERGKFALVDTVHNYIVFIQNRPKNQWGAKGEDETDFDRERLRRTKEEADKLEIFNARSRGELVEIEKVKRAGEKVMSAIKTRILNMPLSEDKKDQCLRDLVSLKEMDFGDE